MFHSKSNFVLFLFLTKAPTRSIVTCLVIFSRVLKRKDTVISDCWVLWRTRIIAPPPEIMRWIIHGRGSHHPSCTVSVVISLEKLLHQVETCVELTPSKYKKNSPSTAVIRYFCNITSFIIIMSREKTKKNRFPSRQTDGGSTYNHAMLQMRIRRNDEIGKSHYLVIVKGPILYKILCVSPACGFWLIRRTLDKKM